MEEEGFPEEEEERRGLEINTSQNRQKTFHIVHRSKIRQATNALHKINFSWRVLPYSSPDPSSPSHPPPALILNASSAG